MKTIKEEPIHYQEKEGKNNITEPNPDGFFSDLSNQVNLNQQLDLTSNFRMHVQQELRTCIAVEPHENNLIIGDKNFQFDHVFAQDSSQEEMFDICAKNLVLGCFSGFNATILAYGQTGSGKTHSMGTSSTMGMPEEQIGIVPRVFSFIFQELQNRRNAESSASEFTIKCSFLELYNEELHDLLDPHGMAIDRITQKPLKELSIREEKSGSIRIDNLNEQIVHCKEECLELLNQGISMRVTSATLMNEGSSRSHAIFTLTIEQKIVKNQENSQDDNSGLTQNPSNAATEEFITAKFHFVDLAGSERIKKTGATGMLLKEGISINKGLLSLGNVISALTEETKKNTHIPYRDSKLTRILQDSLGGNSRTTMIACVSPADLNYEETLNSIKYASRARNIKNKPVVNRDPNSVLIESLRNQISQLQAEILEYQKFIKDKNINLPSDFTERIDGLKSQQITQQKNQNESQNTGQGGFNIQGNPTEIREIKIRLSKKEKELKEIQEQYEMIKLRQQAKDKEFSLILKERDNLRIKNEILIEYMHKHEIQMESMDIGDTSQIESLIDEYKSKVDKLQYELEKKNQEILTRSRKLAEIQIQSQRDEELLRKNLEENQRLKRQIKQFEELNLLTQGGYDIMSSSGGLQRQSSTVMQQKLKRVPSKEEYDPLITNKINMLQGKIMEDFNQKFISNLASQIGNILVNQYQSEDVSSPVQVTTFVDDNNSIDGFQSIRGSVAEAATPSFASINQTNNEDSVEEKEKIIDAVRNTTKNMQSELEKLMKLECDKKIKEIEKELLDVDYERRDNLQQASNDQQKIQKIEKDFKQKMDELNQKLSDYKEKEKKQELVIKQLSNQEAKLKSLELDIIKYKKSKEDIEKQMKQESEKFQKYKTSMHKELILAKKFAQDKDKIMIKLKSDLKKTDFVAQQKVAEIKGLQKRAKEEKQKREQKREQLNESKGIDMERIKDWILYSTSRMLYHKELQEQLDNLMDERERIQDDILQEGEKLTEVMLQKERKQAELQMLESQIEHNDQELECVDEGAILEIESELQSCCSQITSITDGIDSMEQTLNFLSKNINELSEDLASMDADDIEPLKFSGLQSVDAAKVTLQTFFGVMLELNVYKKELEAKCLEQDAIVIEQSEKIKTLQERVDNLIKSQKENQPGFQNLSYSLDQQSRTFQMHKDKAIKSIVDTLEGFVEHEDIKHLNLTPNEKTSLTKLSLAKIVSNLKQKLRELENRNFNLSHKLEQSINEKEQLKHKNEQIKKQQQAGTPQLQTKQTKSITETPKNEYQGISHIPHLKASFQNQSFKFKQKLGTKAQTNHQLELLNQNKTNNQPLSQRKEKEKLPAIKQEKSTTGPKNSLQISAQLSNSSQQALQTPKKQNNIQKKEVLIDENSDSDLLDIKTYIRPKNSLNVIEEKPSLRQQSPKFNQSQNKQISSLQDKRKIKKEGSHEEIPNNDPSNAIRSSKNDQGSPINIRQGAQSSGKLLSLQERRNQRKSFGGGCDTTGRVRATSDAHFSSAHQAALLVSQSLKNMQSPRAINKKLATLQEMRTRKKIEEQNINRSNQSNERSPSEERLIKTEEINNKLDKIKDSVNHIDKNHQERRKSRENKYLKNHELTFQQQLQKNVDKEQLNVSPFFKDLKQQFDKIPDLQQQDVKHDPDPNIKQESDTVIKDNNNSNTINDQESLEFDQSLLDTENKSKYKWEMEELFSIAQSVNKIVDIECINRKMVILFDDFTLQEYDIVSKSKVNGLDLKDLIGDEIQSDEKVTAFAIDKELGLIALACNSQVFLFDFQDGYSPVTKIDIANVIQLCFCQYFIVMLISQGSDDAILECFQIDDELVEVGNQPFKNEGQKMILKSDNQWVYVTSGSLVLKFSVPDLTAVFEVKTEHTAPIVDIGFTQSTLYTTSEDSQLKAFDVKTGQLIAQPIEDLECDCLESEGDYLLTRCGNGAAFLVWKLLDQNELRLIEEIDLNQPDVDILNYKMRAGFVISSSTTGEDYNYTILVNTLQDEISVKAVKHLSLFS